MFDMVHDGCVVGLVQSLMHAPLKCVTCPCYDFGPNLHSSEIGLPVQEIIMGAKGSKRVIICPFNNLKLCVM